MAESGVYIIEAPGGGAYVGSSVNLRARWKKHRVELRAGTHHNEPLKRAAAKYGIKELKFRVLIVAAPENLIAYEQIALDVLRPTYNVVRTAYSHLGAKRSPESRQRIAAANTGRKHSEETRRRLSEARKGVPRGPLTDEHRARIAAANQGAKRSDQAREAMRRAQIGKKQSPETIAKRVAATKAAKERNRAATSF